MANPKLIPTDMRRRAEWLRKRARSLQSASKVWTNRVDEPRAQEIARILADQSLTLDHTADEIDAWADGIE